MRDMLSSHLSVYLNNKRRSKEIKIVAGNIGRDSHVIIKFSFTLGYSSTSLTEPLHSKFICL